MGFVSIILLNYNGKNFNKECVDSILLQSYKDFEIIFVDNASTDGSLEEVENLYENEIEEKKIIIVKNNKNTGFTGGNNLGIKHANNKSAYICLLNNDTIVPISRLEELVKGIESDKGLGAVGSLVLDKGYEEEIKKIYLEKHEVYVTNILGETAKKRVSVGEIESGIYYAPSLSGCCFMYKKHIINEPFPEWYFAYGEDVFFSLLLTIKGYKLAVCTKSIIQHFGSGSFGRVPSKMKLFYGNRNQIINYLIFYDFITQIKLLPLFLFTQIAHIFINVPIKRFYAKISSWLRIIKNIKEIYKLKKLIGEGKKLNNKQLIKQLSYKFSDEIYYIRLSYYYKKTILCINEIFRIYISIFF